jgi:branched-chain amino acid transport system permease protein
MTEKATSPAVGSDEWVARSESRREYLPSWLGAAQRADERLGPWSWWTKLALAGGAALSLPLLGIGPFQIQVGIDTLVLAMLAVGLNICVGWAGLLDLGYIAFFGVGAYGFALLSSRQLDSSHGGVHLPAYLSMPAVMVAAALLGLLVGLPTRRLIGDYLAVVTLFLGQMFGEVVLNDARTVLGGTNGIVGIDPVRGSFRYFSVAISSNEGYYYLLLFLLLATMAVMRLLETSRTGRAWRAVRDDPLAAGSMTVPVTRVRILAFVFGAMIAALTGSVYASQQISVFPSNFSTDFLILIYAALILGGSGSIAGAVTGALVLNVVYDGLLRNATYSGYVFYGLIVLTLAVKLRPWRKLGVVLMATVLLGLAVHAVAGALWPSAVAGGPQSGGWIATVIRDWVIVPANAPTLGRFAYALLVCLVIALVRVKGRWRAALLVPTLYVASVAWEAILITPSEVAVTQRILLAAILIVIMISRPQGIFGTRRVETAL